MAQFKFTVLLMPNGPQKITGNDQEIQTLLKQSANPKAAKKKKKAAEKAVVEETGEKKVEEDMDAAPTLVEQ